MFHREVQCFPVHVYSRMSVFCNHMIFILHSRCPMWWKLNHWNRDSCEVKWCKTAVSFMSSQRGWTFTLQVNATWNPIYGYESVTFTCVTKLFCYLVKKNKKKTTSSVTFCDNWPIRTQHCSMLHTVKQTVFALDNNHCLNIEI